MNEYRRPASRPGATRFEGGTCLVTDEGRERATGLKEAL